MISSFLYQTVTVTPKAAKKHDKWGDPSAGAPVTYQARIEQVQKRVQTDPQTFVDVRLQVWLPALAEIENNDKVTSDGADYKVVLVDRQYDIVGNLNHILVSCA